MRYCSMIVFSWFALTYAGAQQPPPKGPIFPPINPVTAKLDITVTGLDGPGFALAVGGDGDLIVTACEKGTLLAYKKDAIAAFKSEVGKPDVWKGHDGPVRHIAWHGGPTLVSVGTDKKVNFWKVPDGKVTSSAAADFRVLAVALTSDGKTLATAGESDTIQLWDVASGKPTAKLTDKMDWTLSVAFSADGKQLLSGDWIGNVRIWDVAGAKKTSQFMPTPNPAPKVLPDPVPVTNIAYAPDGKSVLLGTAEGPIHVITIPDGKIVRTHVGHAGPITGMLFHPSGTLIATASKDRTVKLWNPAAPAPLKSLDGHGAWIEGIRFLEQGTKLATVSADQTVRIWDLAEAAKKK